jgi:transcriptional regulator with XRE-family HTH domain
MLPLSIVDEIERALRHGESQRQIAARIGVSRATVNGIAKGNRPGYVERLRRRTRRRV